jgi:hypothetical protein
VRVLLAACVACLVLADDQQGVWDHPTRPPPFGWKGKWVKRDQYDYELGIGVEKVKPTHLLTASHPLNWGAVPRGDAVERGAPPTQGQGTAHIRASLPRKFIAPRQSTSHDDLTLHITETSTSPGEETMPPFSQAIAGRFYGSLPRGGCEHCQHCRAGDPDDGGVLLDGLGMCRHFCSANAFCGKLPL